MSLKHYLLQVEKTHKFRIKALFPLDDDDCMALLEKALQKYRPTSVSAPKKTILQTNPLGFTGVKQAEVYIVDVELGMPVTSFNLCFDLKEILGIQQTSETLKVFAEGELDLQETSEPCDVVDEEGEKHEALLASDGHPEVEEAKFSDYFGPDYNTRFLDALKKVEAERKERVKAGPVHAKTPLSTSEAPTADQPEMDNKGSANIKSPVGGKKGK